MIVNGTLFTGMNLSAFGNFTYNVPFTAISDSQGNLTIPKFGNISLYDNTSTYGDNRASVEVGNQIIGFSRDEIVFTYIDHFIISAMSPPMVSTAGQAINFTGDGFINTTTLMCMFGNLSATAVKYFNRTKIQCTTPAVTNTSITYPISISLNGIDYENFTNSTN